MNVALSNTGKAVQGGEGATWYTWLEQARDVQASPSVLDALAVALCLSDAERAHLHRLGRRGGQPRGARVEHVPPAVRRLVEQLGDNPACVIGARWDFLVWNEAFRVVFTDPLHLPEERRNRLWWLFTDRDAQARVGDWEATSQQVVARFRQQCGGDLGDPWVRGLVDDLRAVSPRFAELWRRHEVGGSGDGCELTLHPKAGPLTFEHAVFSHPGSPNLRIVLYSPLTRTTPQSRSGHCSGLEPAAGSLSRRLSGTLRARRLNLTDVSQRMQRVRPGRT